MQDSGVGRLIEESYLNEDTLESLLEGNPELIALDEVDPSAGPLIPIGRQVTLAGQSLDLLFLDASGKLTAVEAKLERNPEIRRQVVAQVLEYGAYLADWDVTAVESQAERYFSSARAPVRYKGVSLYDVLLNAIAGEAPDEWDGHLIRNRIASSLASSSRDASKVTVTEELSGAS